MCKPYKIRMCNTERELDTLKLQKNIPTLIKTATKRNNTPTTYNKTNSSAMTKITLKLASFEYAVILALTLTVDVS